MTLHSTERFTHLHSIGSALPAYRATQDQVISFLANVAAHIDGLGDQRAATRLTRVLERTFAGSGIGARYSVLRDFLVEPADFTFFPPNWRLDPFPTTRQRMDLYAREAPPLALAAVENCLRLAPSVEVTSITHLVVASCTGFSAPGIDVNLARALGLDPSVERTMVGFMGCSAAFNALRVADAICRSTVRATVLVVCVELCSIHFQRGTTVSNILGNCLFGDGAAAALLTSESADSRRGRLRLVASHSELHSEGSALLTWDIGDTGFEMHLASEVPEAIARGVESFADSLCARGSRRRKDVTSWAVHPGGRRILDLVARALEIEPAAMAHSYGVLADHGNTSSPTILLVLDRVATGLSAGDQVVAMGFGPGLTFDGLLLEGV